MSKDGNGKGLYLLSRSESYVLTEGVCHWGSYQNTHGWYSEPYVVFSVWLWFSSVICFNQWSTSRMMQCQFWRSVENQFFFFFFLSPGHLEFSYTSPKHVIKQFSEKKLTNPTGNPIQENGEGDSNTGVNGNNRIRAVQQVGGLKEHLWPRALRGEKPS